MFLFNPVWLKVNVSRFGLCENSFTYYGSFFVTSLLKWANEKLGFILLHWLSCKAFKLL